MPYRITQCYLPPDTNKRAPSTFFVLQAFLKLAVWDLDCYNLRLVLKIVYEN